MEEIIDSNHEKYTAVPADLSDPNIDYGETNIVQFSMTFDALRFLMCLKQDVELMQVFRSDEDRLTDCVTFFVKAPWIKADYDESQGEYPPRIDLHELLETNEPSITTE